MAALPDPVRRQLHAWAMAAYAPYTRRVMRRTARWRWRELRGTVPPGVFPPQLFFSTTTLAALIVARPVQGVEVLDVGTGSGLLALAAAHAGATATAVDINPAAVDAARANAAANGLAVDVIESDLFAAVAGRTFELVVVNPPYFAKQPETPADHAWFAGADLGYFDRFFAGLPAVLAAGGTGLMVLAEGCDLPAITAAAVRSGVAMREVHRRASWFGAQVVHELTVTAR